MPARLSQVLSRLVLGGVFLGGLPGCRAEPAVAPTVVATPAEPTPAPPPVETAPPPEARTVAQAASIAPTPDPAAAWPDPDAATLTAPAEFSVLVQTTKGSFTLDVHRQWGPNGADRFYNLVRLGYFTDVTFFRAIAGFMVQFGLHGDPTVNAAWDKRTIDDDPVVHSNVVGTLSFAKTGAPNSATTQLFINLSENTNLDGMRFTPIAEVSEGMDVVNSLYTGLGEGAPRGRGPSQSRIEKEGNAYLEQFPDLDRIESMIIVRE